MRISDWSSDVCSSDLGEGIADPRGYHKIKSCGLRSQQVAMRLMHKSRVVSLAFEAFNLQADDTGVWFGGTVVSLVAVDPGEPPVSAGAFVHGKTDGNVPSSFHFFKHFHQIILLTGQRVKSEVRRVWKELFRTC